MVFPLPYPKDPSVLKVVRRTGSPVAGNKRLESRCAIHYSYRVLGLSLISGKEIGDEKAAQRGSFRAGYPADIRGSFARISRHKTSIRAL